MSERNKKGSIISFMIVEILLIMILPTIAKIIVKVVENPNFKIETISPEFIFQSIVSIKTYLDMFSNIMNPVYGIALLIIVGYAISYLIRFLGVEDDSTYLQTEEYGSHGTSRWQTVDEIKNNYFKVDVGWFVGGTKKKNFSVDDKKIACIAANGELNMQVVVYGPPGSNKTTGFVLPNIFHLPRAYMERNKIIEQLERKHKNKDNLQKEMPDLIITDPKSELFRLTANDLKTNGYEVHVLDFINLKYGDCINPFDFISSDKEMMEIAKGYISAYDKALGQQNVSDTFFPEQEGQVLAALIGFVLQVCKDKNFDKVTEILVTENVSDPDLAKTFFKEHNIKGAANKLWNYFGMVADSDRTRASILGGLASKLQLFAIDGIKNITSKTTIDIRKLGAKKEKPMALFILMPDKDRTFSPIINVILNIIFQQLYKTAYKTNDRLEEPVYLILEEMANIGEIQNIEEMMGTMRGRRIYPMMIWQSLIQMKGRYKNWEDIFSQCDTAIYLGINDNTTAKYCSEQLGDTTIRIKGNSKNSDTGILKVEKMSESNNYKGRKLLLPDECRRFNNKKIIMIQRSRFHVQLYKIQYRYWKEDERICEDFKLEQLPTIPIYKSSHEEEINNIVSIDETQIENESEQDLENANIDEEIQQIFE